MKLKELREVAGISQRELGERLSKELKETPPKCTQTRISSYESGRNKVPLAVAIKLVVVLNRALKKAKSRRQASIEDLV